MPADDLSRLAALAQQATPGPWKVEHDVRVGGCAHLAITNRACGDSWMPCSITRYDLRREIDDHNAAYIAAVSPEVVKRMIAEMRKMRVALKECEESAYWAIRNTSGAGDGCADIERIANAALAGITDTPKKEGA